MKLYSYMFYEGDEGVVIANSWEEAKKMLEETYPRNEVNVVDASNYEFDVGQCLLYKEADTTEEPKVICTREW